MSSSRAQKLLSNLTSDEQAYFIASTDIFHDVPYSCHGRPSKSRQRQVTVCYNLQKSLSLVDFPALNPALPWDVNIASFPFLTTEQMSAVVDNGIAITSPTSVQNIAFGGISPVATQTGNTFIPSSTGVTAFLPTSGPLTVTSLQWPNYGLALPYERFQYEVISSGFEIVNTTPELYKGGSVIRYRVPDMANECIIRHQYTGGHTGTSNARLMALPPYTPALAMLYPDSVLAKAAEGTYQMHTRQRDSQKRYTDQGGIVLNNPLTDLVNGNSFASLVFCVPPATNSVNAGSPCIIGDLDQIGAYFTGLSPQTTLTIRYRVIISFTPCSLDSPLVALATESPPYNPKLDELISLVQMDLPPGVPCSMNAKGDWWKNILDTAVKFAPAVGAVFGPEGAAIGTALSMAGQGIQALTAPKPRIRPQQAVGGSQVAMSGPQRVQNAPQYVQYQNYPSPQRAVQSFVRASPPLYAPPRYAGPNSNRGPIRNRRRRRSRIPIAPPMPRY